MITPKCPGQDLRYWKPEDIFEENCPHCGNILEFWKTDIGVRCDQCRRFVANPCFDLGCANWCSYAQQCLGDVAKGFGRPDSVMDKIKEAMIDILGDAVLQEYQEALVMAEELSTKRGAELMVIAMAFCLHVIDETFERQKSQEMAALLYQQIGPPDMAVKEADQVLKELKNGQVKSLNARILHKILRISTPRKE